LLPVFVRLLGGLRGLRISQFVSCFDFNEGPGNDGVLSPYSKFGYYEGNIGWSATNGKKLSIKDADLVGDIYRACDSDYENNGTLTGTDYDSVDLDAYISDGLSIIAQFEALSSSQSYQKIDSKDYTFTATEGSDVTVIDIEELKVCGTLTLEGDDNDVFYIRVTDLFSLSDVSMALIGTDASRVFFLLFRNQ
jgi:hypothetical protein